MADVGAEQLLLDVEVPVRPLRIATATRLLGMRRVGECRAILAEVERKSLTGPK